MESNSKDEEEANNQHVIDINTVRLASSMQLKISENPKLLSRVAGNKSCCIFRVPQSLIDANGKVYEPRIVSIGPYHRGQNRLNMIEEHKWRYLGSLLSRITQKGLALENLLQSIVPLESQARECYSETIQLDSDEFIEIMVLDGCFLIELFRKVARLVEFEIDDPLLTMVWILPFFYRDFLKLENQIPFFILQHLFDLTKLPEENSTATLSNLALQFFNNSLLRPDKVIAEKSNTKGMHLLDLVRSSFISSDQETEPKRVITPTHMIHSVPKLHLAGIKITPGKNEEDSFLYVTFKDREIVMPTLTMDDFMSSFLLNCVAFEQCYSGCSKHFTGYMTLLDCLIRTERDVEYLCDRNIIENHFGTEEEVAQFVNNARKDVAVDLDLCYLSELFNEVHRHYIYSWHVQWSSFKYTYVISVSALVLMVLTIAQTYFAAYQYFDPKKS